MGLITIWGYSYGNELEKAELLRARIEVVLEKEPSVINKSVFLDKKIVLMVVPSLAMLPASSDRIHFIEFDDTVDNSEKHQIVEALCEDGIKLTSSALLGPRRYIIST